METVTPELDYQECELEVQVTEICRVIRDSTYLLTANIAREPAILYKYRLIICTLAEVLQDAVNRLSTYRVSKKGK